MTSSPAVTTIFPPIPQTVWRADDPALRCDGGVPRQGVRAISSEVQGEFLRGPHIALDRGFYGIEFQLEAGQAITEAGREVAIARITANDGADTLIESTITAEEIAQTFGGMYRGVRLNLLLDHPVENVEFRLKSLGGCSLIFQGIKLIPRPGRVWFPSDLDHIKAQWKHQPDRSAICTAPAKLGGPSIALSAGEYRVGIKLKPPPDILTGSIAQIHAAGIAANSQEKHVIDPIQKITAEQMLARFGIPDAKMRFRLDELHTQVELRTETLAPGVTVQWVRLCTAEEAVWHHYYNLGGTASPLGRPISSFTPLEPSPQGLSGSVREFDKGSIVWTLKHGPCEVYGDGLVQWKHQGGAGGSLGLPISRPHDSADESQGDVLVQEFEGGKITWPVLPEDSQEDTALSPAE